MGSVVVSMGTYQVVRESLASQENRIWTWIVTSVHTWEHGGGSSAENEPKNPKGGELRRVPCQCVITEPRVQPALGKPRACACSLDLLLAKLSYCSICSLSLLFLVRCLAHPADCWSDWLAFQQMMSTEQVTARRLKSDRLTLFCDWIVFHGVCVLHSESICQP